MPSSYKTYRKVQDGIRLRRAYRTQNLKTISKHHDSLQFKYEAAMLKDTALYRFLKLIGFSIAAGSAANLLRDAGAESVQRPNDINVEICHDEPYMKGDADAMGIPAGKGD